MIGKLVDNVVFYLLGFILGVVNGIVLIKEGYMEVFGNWNMLLLVYVNYVVIYLIIVGGIDFIQVKNDVICEV